MHPKSPHLKQISADEAQRRIAAGTPGLLAQYVGHDDFCRTLKTGLPSDCNCQPEIEFYVIETPKVRRG